MNYGIKVRERNTNETYIEYLRYILNEAIPKANEEYAKELESLKKENDKIQKKYNELLSQQSNKDNDKLDSLISRAGVDLKNVARDLRQSIKDIDNINEKSVDSLNKKIDKIISKQEDLEAEIKESYNKSSKVDLSEIKKLIKELDSNLSDSINNAKEDIIEKVNSKVEEKSNTIDAVIKPLNEEKEETPELDNVFSTPSEVIDYKIPENLQDEMIKNYEEQSNAKKVDDDGFKIEEESEDNAKEKEEEVVSALDQALNPELFNNIETNETPTFEASVEANIEQPKEEEVIDPFNQILNPVEGVVEAVNPIPVVNNEVIAPDASIFGTIAPSVENNGMEETTEQITPSEEIEPLSNIEEITADASVSEDAAPAINEVVAENTEVEGDKVIATEEAPKELIEAAVNNSEVINSENVEEQTQTVTEEIPSIGEAQVISETPVENAPSVETPAVETPVVDTPAEVPAVDTPAEVPAVEAPAEVPAVETISQEVSPEQLGPTAFEEAANALNEANTEVAKESEEVAKVEKASILDFGVRATRSMLNALAAGKYDKTHITVAPNLVNYHSDSFGRFDENLTQENELTQAR